MQPRLGPSGNSNPNYMERRLLLEMDERISTLERQVKLLTDKLGGGVEGKKEITEDYSELKIAELKALCENRGIDCSDFGNRKDPYIKALKEKED